jgi:ketosteroid isomerase-like protein
MKLLRLVPIAFVLCACSDPLDPPAPAALAQISENAAVDLRAARAELLAADRAWSEYSGGMPMIDAVPAFLTDDVAYVHGGSLLQSPQAVRSALAANPVYGVARLTWTAIRADVSGDGQQGVTYGYTDINRPGAPVTPGRYIAYWKREAGGEWKVAAYNRVGRLPGPIEMTPPAGFETPGNRRYRVFPDALSSDPAASLRAADIAFSDRAQVDSVGHAFAAFVAADGATVDVAGTGFAYGADVALGRGAARSMEWAPVVVGAADSGDFGFTTGIADIRELLEDGTYRLLGRVRYLSVWKRQRTGEWRFIVDG